MNLHESTVCTKERLTCIFSHCMQMQGSSTSEMTAAVSIDTVAVIEFEGYDNLIEPEAIKKFKS